MITVIFIIKIMIIKNEWMNNKNNNTTTNVCGNKSSNNRNYNNIENKNNDNNNVCGNKSSNNRNYNNIEKKIMIIIVTIIAIYKVLLTSVARPYLTA